MKFILAILLILISFLEVSASAITSSAQEQLTPAETQAVEEVVNRFVQRLEETGNFAVLVKELYSEDFIQRYIAQQQKELTEAKMVSSAIYFAPGLEYKPDLLKQATAENWKRFYIAVHTILCYGILTGMNHTAPALLKGEEPDDKFLNNIIPPQVVKLFNGHPILKDFVRKQNGRRAIETVEEMRSVVTTLEQAVVLLQQEPPKLTEESKKVIALLKESFRNEHPPEVLENKLYGYPEGTRIFAALTPLMYALRIARIGNKYEIVWAEPFGD
jgi:hypothetical protein